MNKCLVCKKKVHKSVGHVKDCVCLSCSVCMGCMMDGSYKAYRENNGVKNG